jgi:hypothetical protein
MIINTCVELYYSCDADKIVTNPADPTVVLNDIRETRQMNIRLTQSHSSGVDNRRLVIL